MPSAAMRFETATRAISAEVAGVMRMTDRAVQRRIGEARTIIEGFPAATKAIHSGKG